jgi:hypothetical protein
MIDKYIFLYENIYESIDKLKNYETIQNIKNYGDNLIKK